MRPPHPSEYSLRLTYPLISSRHPEAYNIQAGVSDSPGQGDWPEFLECIEAMM